MNTYELPNHTTPAADRRPYALPFKSGKDLYRPSSAVV
jgi:hypothetical protein